ncbi:MAG: enoyl-CoA hydratase/isomerase family protein [Erythrobacter sp.]
MSDTSKVLYEKNGHVAVITMNRPDAMNAFDAEMRDALAQAQQNAEADEDVRIVVLTGSGRAFSSGTDLKEAATPPGPAGKFDNSVRDYKPLVDGIVKSDKIYIAAINGFAGGVALGMCLGADLAIMADDATVFSPFANIGLVPDGGASWDLLHSMGYKHAFAAVAEGTRLDAQACLKYGMINKIVPAGDLLQSAKEWANDLAERAPLSLRYTKQIMRQAATLSREQTALLESEYQMKCINSEDAPTAIMAFLTKQKPTFKGK